ncbi:MAG: hypothetical protein KDK71_07220 [Chlamydiia bacterium]|nr:hypothetical protein [Chlamydiia bacterium]
MENIPGYERVRMYALSARDQLGPLGNALLQLINPVQYFTEISEHLAILSEIKTINQDSQQAQPSEISPLVEEYLKQIRGAVNLSEFFIKLGERFALFSSALSLYTTVTSTPFTNLFSWRIFSIFTYFSLTAWWIGVVVTPIFICIWRDLSVLHAQSIEVKRTLNGVLIQPLAPQEQTDTQPTDWKQVLEKVKNAKGQIEAMQGSAWLLNLLPYPTYRPLCNLTGTLHNIEAHIQQQLTPN